MTTLLERVHRAYRAVVEYRTSAVTLYKIEQLLVKASNTDFLDEADEVTLERVEYAMGFRSTTSH